jgi:hypothetical protein
MADPSRRLHILVEGQTEETIARDVLEPHLGQFGWWITRSIVTTRRPAGGPAFKGGITSWPRLEREIRLLLRDSSLGILTTLFDFYAFPPDAPGMASRPNGSAIERVTHVEEALFEHFGDPRFLPHLVLHEIETWVFAASVQLGSLFDMKLATQLQADVAAAGGPEGINDNPETAPSKRLARYCATYIKTQDGPLAVADLGVDRLRQTCPHLNEWLRSLEKREGGPRR